MSTSLSSPADSAPLLASPPYRRYLRRQSLQEAATFLRRASSRRMMREPSMLVREAAAEQLEERRSDWAYSRPVVVVDVLWNLTFVAVTVAVLALSWHESSAVPLRAWVVGYALQCVIHTVCVSVEYDRRRRYMGGVDETGYVTLAQLNNESNRD